MIKGGIFLALCAALAVGLLNPQSKGSTSTAPSQFTACDAELLMFITPFAHNARSAGYDVVADQSEVPQSAGFYDFYVVASIPPPPGGGIVRAEYFAVNRRTGAIWDAVLDKRVTTREIKDVLGVLRREHRVTPALLSRYDNLRPKS